MKITECLRRLHAQAGLKLAVFTNSPKTYALRCLEALGLKDFFPDDHVFAVEALNAL